MSYLILQAIEHTAKTLILNSYIDEKKLPIADLKKKREH